MNRVKQCVLAAGSVAALAAAGPALGFPMSGGPGTLGVEVPLDSREAREYYQVFLPVDTPEGQQIRDSIQKLRAEHHGLIELATVGMQSEDPRVRDLALRLLGDHQRLEWTLVKVASDSRFELIGAAYHTELQAVLQPVRELQPGADDAFVEEAIRALKNASGTIGVLTEQAREASRQALGSVMAREKSVVGAELDAARALAGARAVGRADRRGVGSAG